MAGLPTYAPEEAPQWVRDVVENLQREHDKRVEEYIALEKMLPTTAERMCLAHAASLIAGTHSARVIARYLDRIAKS